MFTYPYRLEPGDVGTPLGMFQAKKADERDTKELVVDINEALENEGPWGRTTTAIFRDVVSGIG